MDNVIINCRCTQCTAYRLRTKPTLSMAEQRRNQRMANQLEAEAKLGSKQACTCDTDGACWECR